MATATQEIPPQAFASGESPPLELTFDIVDGEDHQWLIRLERPPALPGE